MVMQIILLILFWLLWCALHSVLISHTARTYIQRRYPVIIPWYRLAYNLFAVVSLVPLLFYGTALRGETWFAWSGPWRIPQVFLLASALALFAAGARRYDFREFMGLNQHKGRNDCAALTDDCSLDKDGILGIIRHPWYTAGILIIWARPLDTAAILINLIVSGYLVLGAFLEERKLVRRFGAEYDAYRRQVPMFLPLKWFRFRKQY